MWILMILLMYSDGHQHKFEHSRWDDAATCDQAAHEVTISYLRLPEPIVVFTECKPVEPEEDM